MNLKDLDAHEEEPDRKRLKVAMKDCPKCGECKSLDQYGVERKTADGLSCYCKACNRDRNKAFRNTDSGFLNDLVSRARSSTVKRNNNGRKHTFMMTVSKIKELMRWKMCHIRCNPHV